jgi:type VI secretion system FHA domain protein
MILTLEIAGPQAAGLRVPKRKVFDSAGGTIGRLADNHWALPDPYVSSHHAVIRYRDGTFYIEDTSMNGVFINAPDNRLAKGEPYALKSGDWIFIEPYEIRALVTNDPVDAAGSPFSEMPRNRSAAPIAPKPVDDPFGQSPAPAPYRVPGPPPRPVAAEPYPSPSIVPGAEEVDPLSLLGFDSKHTPDASAPSIGDLDRSSMLSDHYQPPGPAPESPPPPPASFIPEDYDPLGSDHRDVAPPALPPPPLRPVAQRPEQERPRPATAPAPAVQPQAARLGVLPTSAPPQDATQDVNAALAAILAAAGLDRVEVTPELARNFGQILRVVVSGVMDVLKARQHIKSEFRLGMTIFKPADNNPLKFSANVDDALHNLLVKRNAAYLGPVEAFEDAFDDVRNHQMAMLAGVRVAFQSMLAEFDPDRLQEEFDRRLKTGALLSVPAKLRYWDLYREKIRDMVRDADASFRELFGNEFASAYEEQLKRLKAEDRGGNA